MKSYNNKLILEPYQHSGKIKANITTGFASAQQKDKLIGLTVMCDSLITIGNETVLITKGQKAYISEEMLHINNWSTKTYECDSIDGKFIITDFTNIIFVV